jgi:pre-mRNA-processing factor SLU7
VALEVDSKNGKEINPHIPAFIARAPWYMKFDEPTLTHQHAPAKK